MLKLLVPKLQVLCVLVVIRLGRLAFVTLAHSFLCGFYCCVVVARFCGVHLCGVRGRFFCLVFCYDDVGFYVAAARDWSDFTFIVFCNLLSRWFKYSLFVVCLAVRGYLLEINEFKLLIGRIFLLLRVSRSRRNDMLRASELLLNNINGLFDEPHGLLVKVFVVSIGDG